MKIKNSQIILVIATFLGVYILLAGYLSILKPVNFDAKVEEENKVVSEIIPQIGAKPLSGEDKQIELEIELKSLSVSKGEEQIFISLTVLDKNYEIETREGSSVFDVMKELQNNTKNNFSFNYKEYPRMGVFVGEINGIKGKRGAYWIYYVNGKEASVGVSSYVLKEGDSILWKQE
jgi:hypothetical protein